MLQVQKLLGKNEASQHIHDLLVALGPVFRNHELFILEGSFLYLQQHHVRTEAAQRAYQFAHGIYLDHGNATNERQI